MNVLIACEYSGTVREAFKAHGHSVMSCDLLPTETKGKPEEHYQGDIREVLHWNWDLMVAHPPCTHLAVSGAAWFKNKVNEQREALDFVRLLMNAPIGRIVIENPVGIISTEIRPPDQIIQPYFFGDSAQKTTCLWLKNLPKLIPTNIVDKGEMVTFSSGKTMPKWYSEAKSTKEYGKIRSKTFPGIAQAMAEQWGRLDPYPKTNGMMSL